MNKEDYPVLGIIRKPSGTKGELLLGLTDSIPEDFENWESIFIEIDGLLVPFFIEHHSIRSDKTILVKLEDIDAREEAEKYTAFTVYSPLPLEERVKNDNPDLIGFEVYDQDNNFLGVIDFVEDIPGNPLLHVSSVKEQIVLIPFHTDMLIAFNNDNKTIKLSIPDGLLDLS